MSAPERTQRSAHRPDPQLVHVGGHAALRGLLMLLLIPILSLPARAHDSVAVHPEITDAALEKVRIEDLTTAGMPITDLNITNCYECAYNDLWLNRGDLLEPSRTDSALDGGWTAYADAYNGGASGILIGSVIEDGWDFNSEISAPLRHFYHGRSGRGFQGVYPSARDHAGELFEFGLGLHDYTDTSRARSSIYLGRFLHLAEDMSSPAHVHGDGHYYNHTFHYYAEADDYEYWYVPHVLWVNNLLRPILDNAGPPLLVEAPDDIWPDPVPPGSSPLDLSLGGYTYNRTSYAARLDFPDPDVDPLLTHSAPAGELAEMFPGFPVSGLHFVPVYLTMLNPHWVIDEVGEYWYMYEWGLPADNWWPNFASDEDPATVEPHGVMAYYYIENLNTGDTLAEAIRPRFHRENYELPWSDPGNLVVANDKCIGGSNSGSVCAVDTDCPGSFCGYSFLERQSSVLLGRAAVYAAGAAKWWYRIADLPPYLEGVEARQGAPEVVKYEANWYDIETDVSHSFWEADLSNTREQIATVTERLLNYSPQTRVHINALADLDLVLTFNEPIREITELKLAIPGGADVLDIGVVIVPSVDDPKKIWTYVIPAAMLEANSANLNGELTLVVRATDMNEHWQGIGGELDGTPQSPAKRAIGGWPTTDYPWYTDADPAPGPDFAYDYVDGDRTHQLLFDCTAPTVTIQTAPTPINP